MIFFTSDTHFYHKNLLTKFNPDTRRGNDEVEMTELMIQAWNNKISKDDIVYHLGDVSFGNEQQTKNVLNRLNGSIHLIKGNHDKVVLTPGCQLRFTSIQDYKRIIIDNIIVIMFHYPIYEWDQMHRGAFHLFGHVHGHITVDGRAMDVGIDTRVSKDMAPYSWDEVKTKLLHLPIRSHH